MDDPAAFELSVSTFFDAAHRLLAEHYGSGTRLHGHTYQVVVTVRGDRLRDDGMLVNHYDVRGAIQRVIGNLHDGYLNDVEALKDLNTTPEVIAQHLWRQLEAEMAVAGVTELSVEVSDSPSMRARYKAAVNGKGSA